MYTAKWKIEWGGTDSESTFAITDIIDILYGPFYYEGQVQWQEGVLVYVCRKLCTAYVY